MIAIVAVLIILGGYYYFVNYYKDFNPPDVGLVPVVSQSISNIISIKNFAFNPAVLSVKAGDTVIWTNNDSASHRISGTGFQSSDLSNGQSYSFTFSSTGTVDYICSIHPSMKGKIVVK